MVGVVTEAVPVGTKYKNISSAIHNIGHSFVSLMNYVDDGYVLDELSDLHEQAIDMEIDWLKPAFYPQQRLTARIAKSMALYHSELKDKLKQQGVELSSLREIKLKWPAHGRLRMCAVDDRGKEYAVYVSEFK